MPILKTCQNETSYQLLLDAGFLLRIKMDVDADKHRPEGIMTIIPDFQVLKVVIIEYSVVHALICGALRVKLPVLLAVSWYGRKVP